MVKQFLSLHTERGFNLIPAYCILSSFLHRLCAFHGPHSRKFENCTGHRIRVLLGWNLGRLYSVSPNILYYLMLILVSNLVFQNVTIWFLFLQNVIVIDNLSCWCLCKSNFFLVSRLISHLLFLFWYLLVFWKDTIHFIWMIS